MSFTKVNGLKEEFTNAVAIYHQMENGSFILRNGVLSDLRNAKLLVDLSDRTFKEVPLSSGAKEWTVHIGDR